MSLDVLTENGQIAVEHSRRALELIGKKYVETKQDTIADIDGFMLNKSNEIMACYEIKSRNTTLDELEGRFDNEWIITYDKIIRGAAIAKALQIPFCGILYLVNDDISMLVTIADEIGELCVPIRVVRSKTQATCNGGTANRVNAYVNMDSARKFFGKQ
jgi:hypothetical protein